MHYTNITIEFILNRTCGLVARRQDCGALWVILGSL